jgi:hypothetical protein
MNKNTKIIGVVVIVIALGLSFYGGMKYAQGNAAAAAATRGANFRTSNGVGGAMRGNIGSGTAGNIISKDATSITVGLRAGGSKIVFFSPTTPISAIASGTPADLISGKQVVVTGSTNTDGSINATSIQVR